MADRRAAHRRRSSATRHGIPDQGRARPGVEAILTVAAALVAVVLVAVVLVPAAMHRRSPSSSEVVGSTPSAATSATAPLGRESPSLAPKVAPGTARATGPNEHWLQVLAAIDGRRSAAYRTGDVAGLDAVYTQDCPQLRVDRAVLRGYRRRGLVVSGVTLSYFVVTASAAPHGGELLLVVDRLGPAVARNPAGGWATLPADQPTRHRILLRRDGGHWRIARVRLA